MRISSIKFVTRNDDIIELRNYEDFVINVYINDVETGLIICPPRSRRTVGNPERSNDKWIELIVARVREHLNFEINEIDMFISFLQESLDNLA